MNASSTIEISKSSLLSLKAEILRKQQEVNKAKILQAQIQQTQTPLREKIKGNGPAEKNEPKNKGVEERLLRDEEEDVELLQKSRKMLESKSRLYNRLVKGPGSLTQYEIEMNKHYLVEFDRKDKNAHRNSSDEEHFSDEYEPADDPENEWVEYTDCLGRTRKCLRKDLEFIKEKDSEFSKTIREKNSNKDAPKWVIDKEPDKIIEEYEKTSNNSISNVSSDNYELLSSDMRREMLRQEWEKQERELLNKKDIHYQDILFNEARSHGVGYYSFSKDDEERLKQQEELRKLRKETTEKQKASLEQKAMREKHLAARLKAARNRKRARMGLPPEEDVPEFSETAVQQTEENKEVQHKDSEKEAEEKQKEQARRKHVRAWDIGKEGVVPHYEYSQEEWVDKKRLERPTEFAPPSIYNQEKQKHHNKNNDYLEQDKSLFFTTKKSENSNKRHSRSINPYKNNSDLTKYDEDDSDTEHDCVDFDDKQQLEENNVQKKYSGLRYSRNMDSYTENSYEELEKVEKRKTFESTPIVNECDIDVCEDRNKQIPKRQGVEIAPPPTFDYYGPSSTKYQKTSKNENLEESIAAGLKYLREKAELKEKSGRRRDFE